MLLGGVIFLADSPLKIFTHFWVFATVGSGIGRAGASGVSTPASFSVSIAGAGGAVGSAVGSADGSSSAATYPTAVATVVPEQALRPRALVSATAAKAIRLRFMIPPEDEQV